MHRHLSLLTTSFFHDHILCVCGLAQEVTLKGLEAMHAMPEQLYDGPRCNSITYQPFWVTSSAIFDACSFATEDGGLCHLGTTETVKESGLG